MAKNNANNNQRVIDGYLKQFELHSYLSELLVANIHLKRLTNKELLYRRGEPLEQIYFLVQGKLEISTFSVEGQQVIYAFAEPFTILGEPELFDNQPIFNNVQSIGNSTLLAIPVAIIYKHALQDPQFLHLIIRQLKTKLMCSSNLLAPSHTSLEKRVLSYLEYRFNLHGSSFELENRESIAAMLRTSVRHLNRVLNKLKQVGTISLKYKSLTILDENLKARFNHKN